jgi:hypothetical protein
MTLKVHYEPNSQSREKLAAALKELRESTPIDIPVIVNGKEVGSSGDDC